MTEALARLRGSTSIPGTACSLCGGPETGSGSAVRARGRPAAAPPLPGPPPGDASWLEQLSDHGESGVSSARSRPGEVSVEPRGEESREVRALVRAGNSRTSGWNCTLGPGPGRAAGAEPRAPAVCAGAERAVPRREEGAALPAAGRGCRLPKARRGKGARSLPERLCSLLPEGGRQTPETPGPAAAQVRQVGWGVPSSAWG